MIKASALLLGILFLAGCGRQSGCVDSDDGKSIYVKGRATTSENGTTLHISSDSCATKNPSEEIYAEGLPACSGDSCYVMEGICRVDNRFTDRPMIDSSEAISCPDGCDDGACIARL